MRTTPIRVQTLVPLAVVALLLAVPVALGWGHTPVASGMEAHDHEECNDELGGQPLLRTVEDVRTHQQLYSLFKEMPGFVDVYRFDEANGNRYQAIFIHEVPPQALVVETPVPVEFEVIANAPQPTGPGLLPTANDVTCGGIRPGMLVSFGGALCTGSYIFTDGSDTYISTAGHCTSVGQRARLGSLQFGTTVFSTGDGGPGNDFALVKIDSNRLNLVDPEMCNFAGPTGIHTDADGTIIGDRIVRTGHGGGFSIPPTPHEGVGIGWGATSLTWVHGPVPGDSGSPIRHESGEALGVVTHVVITPTTGFGIATRLDHGMALANIPGLQLSTVSYTHLGG